MRGAKSIIIVAVAMGACSFPRPADVPGGDAGSGTDGGCSATSCAASEPICEASGTCGACSAESDCGRFASEGLPHCASTGACVACRDSNDCPQDSPFCDNFTCRGCESDNDCPSAACEIESGTCFDEADTIYIAVNGTGNCTKANPCGSFVTAMGLVTSTRKYIKVEPGTYLDDGLTFANQTVVVSGPGATVSAKTLNHSAVSLSGTADLTVYDMTFDANTTTAPGVYCSIVNGPPGSLNLQHVTVKDAGGWGIRNDGGCALRVERSLIVSNGYGGMQVTSGDSTPSIVVNNFIVHNGIGSTHFGGADFEIGACTTCRFDFNTVADNTGNGTWSGLECNGGSSGGGGSNIIYGNHNGASVDSCQWGFQFSVVGPDNITGTTNVDPLFKAPGSLDFTLQATSPARNLADPSATLDIDYQGEVRPQGPGREPGADEIP